ncbi:hypothetical protein EGJ52_08660 [Pseudomonas luteola]|uniref:hypothetical protein n=1 Tax=Pseudomonas luteola TaxID=47886 RepID=UPI000F76C68D|nr:hypothetical protein [Pseudomonas luteola]RRW45081.1 hypothetical protein EGJ52_08660 [Pseudomonas luteola]
MSFTIKPSDLKKSFKFAVKTDSVKVDTSELIKFQEEAMAHYSKPVFTFSKQLLVAPSFAYFARAVVEAAKDGWEIFEDERPLGQSAGHYAMYLVKPKSVQNEDKEWIKTYVKGLYEQAVESNQEAMKNELKQSLIAQEKAKQAEAARVKAEKEQSALEKKIQEQYEQLISAMENA